MSLPSPLPDGKGERCGRLMDIKREYLTVSELTTLIKYRLETEPVLNNVMVKGEISNFKHHTSGHMYFTLKDTKSRLRCVMFRNRNIMIRFKVEDGLTVLARGDIGVYEAAGEYQLYVNELYPAGQGALFFAFEQLKKKLAAEGLFDQERKRPLPFLPRTVGVVTSPTGAAWRDIMSVIRRRNPKVNIVIAPAIVQGEAGAASVVAAIELMNEARLADVLIVGRGGGSLEELWVFNEEAVARAVAASKIPVISAVGHETDFTITDFAADFRAPTPSAAAELAVPEYTLLHRQVEEVYTRMLHLLKNRVHGEREKLGLLQKSPVMIRPLTRINQLRQSVDDLVGKGRSALEKKLQEQRSELKVLAAKLNSLSPLATLERGYAICRIVPHMKVVRQVAQVKDGTELLIRVTDGDISACVRM
jgi:exodeoxyribonuclease VII large subunit